MLQEMGRENRLECSMCTLPQQGWKTQTLALVILTTATTWGSCHCLGQLPLPNHEVRWSGKHPGMQQPAFDSNTCLWGQRRAPAVPGLHPLLHSRAPPGHTTSWGFTGLHCPFPHAPHADAEVFSSLLAPLTHCVQMWGGGGEGQEKQTKSVCPKKEHKEESERSRAPGHATQRLLQGLIAWIVTMSITVLPGEAAAAAGTNTILS